MNERRQCAERWGSDRCELAADHVSHHKAGVILWDRALVRKPVWLTRGQFRRWTPA